MGSLLDFALLQRLWLLKSEQSRSERVRKIVCRSAKSSNDPTPFSGACGYGRKNVGETTTPIQVSTSSYAENAHAMISLLRWIIALPLGVAAALATHIFLGFIFSLAHGFNEVELFWQSSDMAGMPISGTYMMFATRVTTSAVLIWAAVWVVPKFKQQTSIALAVIVSVSALALLVYLLYESIHLNLPLGFGGWYRNILEMVSIVMGSLIGFACPQAGKT